MRPHAYDDIDERATLLRILADRAEQQPDRLYLTDISNGGSLTFAQTHERSLIWADAFRRIGLKPGDRLGVMLPNSFNAVSAWLGSGWVRAYEVPLNNALRGPILQYTLSNAAASMVVVSERFAERIGGVAAELPQLRTIVVPDATREPTPIRGIRILTGDEFLNEARPASDLPVPMPWDIHSIVYTSGTTGPSKGVVSPWGMFTLVVAFLDDLGSDDIFYSPFPMFHIAGKAAIAQAAYMGGRVVFREAFDTGSFWKDIDEHGCTFTALVPAMAHWLLAQPASPEDRGHTLRKAVCTPIVPGLGERFGLSLRTHFGMTEVGNVMSRREVKDSSPSCGRPLPGYEVRIVDEHDYEVPPGDVGELVVRTYEPWWLNAGYWRMPEKTAAAWRNGWFHTGDLLRRDEQGNFYFVDRDKDALRRRGENISSFEVEALVAQHPDVAECAAIGVDTDPGEQDVKVCVVLQEGAHLTPEALLDFLIPIMPRFMVPRFIEFVDSLPKTEATLRVQKAKLRQDPRNDRTWDREAAGVQVPK